LPLPGYGLDGRIYALTDHLRVKATINLKGHSSATNCMELRQFATGDFVPIRTPIVRYLPNKAI
jgi:hypothetical protein